MRQKEDFYIGKHRISPCTGGYWVYPNDGARGKFYAKGSRIAQSIEGGSRQVFVESRGRTYKFGTHEPVFYLRDENGKVGVPPAGGLDVPEGCTLHEARTLQEIDAITAEMRLDLNEQVRDTGMATAVFDQLLGNPMETLQRQMDKAATQIERDVTELLIKDLENLERMNREIHGDIHFVERER